MPNRIALLLVSFPLDSWSRQQIAVNWQFYLNHHQRRVLKALRGKAKGKEVPIYLILDSTINPKRGQKMDWVGNHYSHAHQRVINGHCLVSAQLVHEAGTSCFLFV